eukprot:1161917-Pelagomonas_calceolata.AAC.10
MHVAVDFSFLTFIRHAWLRMYRNLRAEQTATFINIWLGYSGAADLGYMREQLLMDAGMQCNVADTHEHLAMDTPTHRRSSPITCPWMASCLGCLTCTKPPGRSQQLLWLPAAAASQQLQPLGLLAE